MPASGESSGMRVQDNTAGSPGSSVVENGIIWLEFPGYRSDSPTSETHWLQMACKVAPAFCESLTVVVRKSPVERAALSPLASAIGELIAIKEVELHVGLCGCPFFPLRIRRSFAFLSLSLVSARVLEAASITAF